jgi:glycosyltransferase involved in cell wall biosynthesis
MRDIVHIIPDLNTGGAEKMLYKLIKYDKKNNHVIISLTNYCDLENDFRSLGVPVVKLNMEKKIHILSGIYKAIKVIRKLKEPVLLGWMYKGIILMEILSVFFRNCIKIWNIRHSLEFYKNERLSTRIILKLLSVISNSPNGIINNSHTSKIMHEKIGIINNNSVVIPNGFEVDLFKKNNIKRSMKRSELDILPNDFVVGIIGRYHEIKNHNLFISISGILKNKYNVENIKFVMVGEGLNWNNDDIVQKISENGLERQFILLDKQNNIPEVLNLFDTFVLCSKSEGFPNALGEAMLVEIPSITTDVGDCAWLLGDDNYVFDSNDYEGIAELIYNIKGLSYENRRSIGESLRKRILELFDINIIVNHYNVYFSQCHDLRRKKSNFINS